MAIPTIGELKSRVGRLLGSAGDAIKSSYNNDASALGIARNTVTGLPSAARQVLSQGPGEALSNSYQGIARNPYIGTAVRLPEELFKTTFSGTSKFVNTSGKLMGEGLAYATDPNVRKQYLAGNTNVLPTLTNTTLPKLFGQGAQSALELAPMSRGGVAVKKILSPITGKLTMSNPSVQAALMNIGKGTGAGYGFDVAANLGEGKTGPEAFKPGLGTLIGGGMSALPVIGAGLSSKEKLGGFARNPLAGEPKIDDFPMLSEAGKRGMPGEVSSDGLFKRGTDGKWKYITKKESGNSFKVESLNEKTLTPDGGSYVVEVQTSRAGKVSVVKSIVDGNGEKQFIESVPLEKAQAKYQTTDPATLAERMVNPFKDYNYKTDLYNKAQGESPLLQEAGKFNGTDHARGVLAARDLGGVQSVGAKNVAAAEKVLQKSGELPMEIKTPNITRDYIQNYYETKKTPVVGDVFISGRTGERVEITKIDGNAVSFFLKGKKKGIAGNVYTNKGFLENKTPSNGLKQGEESLLPSGEVNNDLYNKAQGGVPPSLPPQFSPKTTPIIPEPSIDDFPLLSGRTPIAGVNDTRQSAIKAARVPVGKQELNVNNLNLSQEQKMEVATITGGKKKTKMSNASVSALSDSVGTDMSIPNIGDTREIVAKQLNTRRKVVSLENEFDQMRLNGASPEEQLKRIREIDSVGTAAQAQGTDIARKLQARVIMADESKTPMQRVFGMMREAGVPSDKYTKAAVGVDFKDANAVAKFYRSMVPAKAAEWLDAVRYSSMLSSPITHIVNISSNLTSTGFVRPIVKTLTGGVDFVRATATGTKQTQFAGEGVAHSKGYWSSVGKGWGKFIDTMAGKQSIENIDYSRMPLAPGSKTATALNFPMKLLEGMDQFFMTMAEGGEKSSLQYRQGKGIRVPKLGEQATLEAQKSVFRQKLGGEGQGVLNESVDMIPQAILGWRNSKKPLVKFLANFTFPFIGTPTNIIKQGLDFTPGVGALNLIGGGNKPEIVAKQIFGAATFLGAASLFASGKTTGAEPTDQKQKNEFRAAGMQPYSVQIGDNWYSYSKLHPAIAFPLAAVAMIHDAQENKKIGEDEVTTLVKTFARFGQFFADQSYMKSMGGFLDSVKGGESAISSQISNYWLQVVPYRALTGWIARMIDDVQRKVDPSATFLEKQGQLLMMNLPLLSQNVPARLDSQGNPIQAQHPFINALSPVRVSTENPQMKDFYDTHQEVLKSGRQDQQVKDILNSGRKLPDNVSQAQPFTGNGEIVPMNGEFYAKIGKRGFVKFDSEEEAQQAINRDKFEGSGKPVEVIDGMVYRRGKNGKSLPPVLLTDYEERVYNAQLTQAKATNDFQSWILTARDRYRNLNEQLDDPTLDDLDRLEVQNKINGLVKQAALYSRYGGFKKPKSYKGKKIKFKTSFKPSTSKSLGTTKAIKPAPFKPLSFSTPSIDLKPYRVK